MAFIPKPKFPNVPNLPGVPQLLRSPGLDLTPLSPVLSAAAALGALWRGLFGQNKWGVYDQPKPAAQPQDTNPYSIDPETGERVLRILITRSTAQPKLVVDADSVLDFGYRNEVDIPDFPIQDGAFANYNRVNLAYEASVRFSKGGSVESRRKFLDQIDTIMASTDLLQIVTPERTYTNVNPIRFELIRRGSGGAFFLTEVDLYFREIRTVTPQYTTTSVTTTNAVDPSAQATQNRGTVNGERPAVEPVITGVVNQ